MTMNKKIRWALAGAAILVAFFAIKSAVDIDRMVRIGAGYKAKILCSEVFLAGRPAADVLDVEFINIDPSMDLINVRIDEEQKRTSASAFGLGRARAVYREGYGCTLANGGRISVLPPAAPPLAADPWPRAPHGAGKALSWVDYAAIDAALTGAFEHNDTGNRAIVVIVDGKIVDERYADGFGPDTPFLSWSMGKSVLATLIGAAAEKEFLDIKDRASAPEWAGDAGRSRIKWRDLLQMQSGLAFGEDYADLGSDVNKMLFESANTGAVAAKKHLVAPPGSAWHYSSGTTNFLSRTLRQTLERADINYHAFAREALFDQIGAASMILEPDASGAFIGSSFVYGTARDWARLGQLYLQDGVWDGRRILPEFWSEFVSAPASQSDNQYGAHFWLNFDGAADRERFFPGLPQDVYFMAGHEGQYVIIIPSKNAVIVRTGITRQRKEMEAFRPTLEALYAAIGNAPASLGAGR